MKVTRRRTLFYQRRTSNLYHLFILALLILAGFWFTAQLSRGAIRNPFSPTPTSTRTINSFVSEGDAFFDAGDLNAAIQAYQQATEVDSGNALVWAKLARIQAYSSRLLSNDSDRLTRLTDALTSADRALALAGEDSDVLAIHAFVLDWNADPALDPLRSGSKTYSDYLFSAEQDALHALQMNNKNAMALAFYAEILIDQQKWTQAEQYILQAVDLGPQVMDVHRVYAAYLESIGDYNQAIQEYEKALGINPNLTFLYISIGQNYRTLAFKSPPGASQTALYNSALDNFSKAATINTQLQLEDPLPYLAIAKTYAQEGEFFASALNAQKAVQLDPTNADLYGQLGDIYKRGRNFETAIIALRCSVRGCTAEDSCSARNGCPIGDPGVQVKGLSLNPNSATYYLDYGSVLSAFAPIHPEYCPEVISVLTQLKDTYPDNSIIVRNSDVGLAICNEVSAGLTQTPIPGLATPIPPPATPVYYTTP